VFGIETIERFLHAECRGTRGRPKTTVTVDGRGVVAHAGVRLLTDLAEVTGLTEQFCEVLARRGSVRVGTSLGGSRSISR
jgi:hypothetical protein